MSVYSPGQHRVALYINGQLQTIAGPSETPDAADNTADLFLGIRNGGDLPFSIDNSHGVHAERDVNMRSLSVSDIAAL